MTPTDPTAADPLDPVVADYFQQVEAGRSPDRADWLARHPDLAARLRAFFADLDRIGQQASAFRLPDSTVSAGGSGATDLPRVRYVGDYELLEEVARGGMGVVYKARQVSLNRVVAVKMILAGTYATEAARQRFKQEAEAAAALDHPNILPIYEIGEHEGHQYFSMKLVDSPRTAVRGLSVEALIRVARAVHFAHQRGILHRDLKPSNVLTDQDGTPYVTDFGLAKKVDADDGRTRTGAVVGTPAYMAPEQARGEKGLSTAVDVYSLGAILYETLTGRPPFQGDTALDTLRQVTDREPAHPLSVNPQADPDLAVIALKCLEKDPARRYPSAAALADDVERWRRGEPIEARPATRRERAVKWARRNPLGAALAGLGAFTSVAILGLLIVALQQASRAIHREADALKARNDAVEAGQRATEARAAAERRLYGVQILVAQSAHDQNQVRQARRALDAADPALRGWEWHYLDRAIDLSRETFSGGGMVRGLTYSADGRRLAWFDPFRGGVYRVEVDRPDQVRELARVDHVGGNDEHPTPFVAASPDLSCAACYTQNGPILVVDGSDKPIPLGPRRPDPKEAGWFRGSVCFAPDGRHLYTAGDRRLACWDVATRKPAWEFPLDAESLTVVAVSADEGLAAVGFATDKVVRVYDLRRKAEVFKTEPHLNVPLAAEFTPDGKRLVTHCAFRNPAVWDLATGKQLLENSGYWAEAYALTRDAKVGAMGMFGGEVILFDAVNGRELQVCRGHTESVLAVAFSPDGRLVASGGRDRTVRLWSVPDGRLVRTLVGHEGPVSAVAFSPDGATLATGDHHDEVKLWDLGAPRRSNGSQTTRPS